MRRKQEYKVSQQDFEEIFDKQIRPILLSYEVYRKKECKKVYLQTFWIPCICVLGTMLYVSSIYLRHGASYTFHFVKAYFFFWFFLVMFIINLCIKNNERKNKVFKTALKTHCLPKFLDVYKNIKWKNNSIQSHQSDWISNFSIEDSGLFPSFNRRYTDDEYKGSYKGVEYAISETHLLQKDENKDYPKEIFKGIIIRFKFNKTIKGETIITAKLWNFIKDSSQIKYILLVTLFLILVLLIHINKWDLFLYFWIPMIIMMEIFLFSNVYIPKNPESLEKVNLEDVKFNKKFNVYSPDQVEARYLVTPAFMERLYNLKTNFCAKDIKCSFCNKYLTIAIFTEKDLFEFADLYHSLLKIDSYLVFFKDISSILDMVENFKLDEKTGL